MVEKIGSGINKIKEECKKHGNIEFTIETNGYFIATFKLLNLPERILEKGVENLSNNEIIILNLIRKNSFISKEEMMIKGNLTKKTIEYNVEKLKQKGLLKRVGPNKGGYWEIQK